MRMVNTSKINLILHIAYKLKLTHSGPLSERIWVGNRYAETGWLIIKSVVVVRIFIGLIFDI